MNAIPSSLIEHAGWVLLHSVWQFAAVAVLIHVGNRLLEKASASARYMLLLSGLLLVTIAPVATWFVLPKPLEDTTVAEVEPSSLPLSDELSPLDTGVAQLDPAFEYPAIAPSEISELPTIPPAGAIEDVLTVKWYERLADVLQPWLSTIVVLWFVGVLLFSVRPVFGWLNIRRLRIVGTSPVTESVQQALQSIAERLQVNRRVEILASTVVKSPIVVGCFRSVILLPTSFIANVPASQLEAILAHELAHVRRYDYLVNLLQTLIETLFFYHPAVWWLSHRIRIERENCCDDFVVATFTNKADYGRALLAVEEFRNMNVSPSTLALGAHGGSLLDRVRRLVNPPGQDERAGSAGAVALTMLTIGLLAIGFWASTETQANDETIEPMAIPHQTADSEDGSSKGDSDSDLVKIVESFKKRRIDPERFAPSHLMNFIDGFGTSAPFQYSADDPGILAVPQWLEEAPPFDGDVVWLETDWGARARPDTRPFRSEARLGQFLAALAEAEVPASQKLTARGLDGQATTVTVADVIADLKRRVSDDQEMTFVLRALIYYLPLDAEWQNQEGETWNIERLAQTVSNLTSSGKLAHNGGTSQLYALAIALDRYHKDTQEKALPTAWKNVEKVVANGLFQIRHRQHPDGSLPWKLNRFTRDASLSQRLLHTGTSLSFILAALPASELNAGWIQRALSCLRNDIEAVLDKPVGTRQVAFAVKAFTLYTRKTNGKPLAAVKQPGGIYSPEDSQPPDSYVAHLPDGQSIELVGMTKNQEPASEGWRPDGRRMHEGVDKWGTDVLLGGNARDFLFRLDGLKTVPSLRFCLPGRGAHFSYMQPDQLPGPWQLRVGGSPGDESRFEGGYFRQEAGVVQVAVTDEPWGKWLRVSATDGTILNPLTETDQFIEAYNAVQIRRVESLRAASDPRDLPAGPGLTLSRSQKHALGYGFRVRGIDSAGEEVWLVPTSDRREVDGKPAYPVEKTWRLYKPLPKGRTLSRFEFRLRPYRHLVTFENVATEQPNDRTSQVKVSVEKLQSVKEPMNAKLVDFSSAAETIHVPLKNEPAVMWIHSKQHVHFVLYHEGFIQTGVSYSEPGDTSPYGWKWRFDGNINLSRGQRVSESVNFESDYRRSIPLNFRFEPPNLTLKMDNREYDLADGRVFVVGQKGKPIQLSLPVPSPEKDRNREALNRFKKQVRGAQAVALNKNVQILRKRINELIQQNRANEDVLLNSASKLRAAEEQEEMLLSEVQRLQEKLRLDDSALTEETR